MRDFFFCSMAKRRVIKPVKQNASPHVSTINGADPKEAPSEKKEDAFKDQEVERQCAAIRAIRDVEVEQLQTWLRLLRSHFTKEQLQTPVLQFFKENLPNLSVLSNGKDGHCEVQWRDKDGISMDQADGRNIHASLLHRMSMVHPDCSATLPSFSGFEFSSKAVKTSLLGAENPQIGDFALEEPSNSLMFGLQDAFQTPGANSQRLSVGVTPKTLRLPKHGEMLLSVRGSPLGVFKEDNMEAIRESEED